MQPLGSTIDIVNTMLIFFAHKYLSLTVLCALASPIQMHTNNDVNRKYLEINLYCTLPVVTERYVQSSKLSAKSVYCLKKTILVLTYICLTGNADRQTKNIHIY